MSRLIHRLEQRFGHWATPHLLMGMATLQGVIYVITVLRPDTWERLVLTAETAFKQPWRLLSTFFVPLSMNPLFFLMGLMFTAWAGRVLTEAWGAFRMNLFVIATALCVILTTILAGTACVGSIHIATAVMLALGVIIPNHEMLILFIIPVRIKWIATLTGVVCLTQLLSNFWGELPTLGAVLPFLIAFGPQILRSIRNRGEVSQRKAKFDKGMNNKSEAFHTCKTCGLTEIADAHAEFRIASDGEEYCTKCLPASSSVL